MKILRVFGFLVAGMAAFLGGYLYKTIKVSGAVSANNGGRRVLYWVDPMHPWYKSDKPGTAPDCGMKLEPVYAADGGPSPASANARKVLYDRDPKAPDYESQQPGLNPETGNDLKPVYAADISAMPVGTVEVTPEKQQLIGVKYGYVEKSSGLLTIRAAGKVTFDETRIQHIHTKVEGWIDQVFVDYTGQLVKKGQPLMTVYSPEMLASQQELLLAVEARDTMRNNPLPRASDQSESRRRERGRRLELWDLSEAQIDQVLKTGQPIKNITLYSPIAGYVTDRKAFPQLKVMPETDLYTVVDLSRVWVVADLFEYEAPNVHLGERARVSLQAVPGKTFTAQVNYIQPQVDPTTRTLKVRLNMENPDLVLKPDMYANVELQVSLPVQLTVPADAVLNSGERKTVFVDRGNGFFEPRRVTTGEHNGDRIQVLSGLNAGERIVTSGNFLIDSESQMKAAAAGMAGMPGRTNEPMSKGKAQEDRPGKEAMPGMPSMEDKK